MRLAIWCAALLTTLVAVPWWGFRWRQRRNQIVRFFWRHEVYYRQSGRRWLSAKYVSAAYGLGTHRHLRALAADGVLERSTDAQGEIYRVRGNA